jgi:hypothetical protein
LRLELEPFYMTPMRHGGGCQHQYCLHHFDAELNLDPPFYFNPDPDPALHFNAEVDSDPTFHIDVWAHFLASKSSMAPLQASKVPA